MYSFRKYLLFNIYCVPGMTLWVRAIAVYETDEILILLELIFQWSKQTKSINKQVYSRE